MLKGPLASVSPKFLEEYLRNSVGVVVLSACAYDQTATTQSPSNKYSLFTHFLIPVLAGQVPEIFDGQLLTLSGLSNYLSVQVLKTSKSQHHVQIPGIETSHLNEIIIGNFQAPIIDTESWDPSESPIDSLLFSDNEKLRVNDVLTEMKFWTRYSKSLIVKMVNENLDSYFEDNFGEISTKLCQVFNFNHREVIIDGRFLTFPGGEYEISYASEEKKIGTLTHEVRIGSAFLDEPTKIPLLIEAIGITPTKMVLDLSQQIDPLNIIPGLKASQWEITSQLQHKVSARHRDGIIIEFQIESVSFSGFSPRELWGDSANRKKASLITGAMTLIGRR